MLLLLLAGCDPSADPDGGAECLDDGRVEVGAGGSRLTRLPETGGELPIVHGSQGGIHVVVGVWVRELPLELDLTYRLVDPSTDELVGTPTSLHLTPGLFQPDGARQQRHPDLVILNNEAPDVGAFAGRTVLLTAEVAASGAHACDTREVTLVDPP